MSEDYQYTPTEPPFGLDPEVHGWLKQEFSNIQTSMYEKLGMFGRDGDWSDLLGDFAAAAGGGGGNAPTWSNFQGNIDAWLFSATVMDELFLNIHVLHDYKRGSELFPHIHWAPSDTDTGVVRWGIEYTVAKGHGQQAFPAPSTIYLEQAGSGTAYMHQLIETAEGSGIPATNIEPDTIIMIRVFRDGAHPNDTYASGAFGLFVDIHYQMERIGTPGKAPDFYKGT